MCKYNHVTYMVSTSATNTCRDIWFDIHYRCTQANQLLCSVLLHFGELSNEIKMLTLENSEAMSSVVDKINDLHLQLKELFQGYLCR